MLIPDTKLRYERGCLAGAVDSDAARRLGLEDRRGFFARGWRDFIGPPCRGRIGQLDAATGSL